MSFKNRISFYSRMLSSTGFKFNKPIPVLKEAHSYWDNVTVLDIDEIMSKDADLTLQNIGYCQNLKEVKFTQPRNEEKFKSILNAIAPQLPSLEVLNIPEIELNGNTIDMLSSCVNLRTLNVNIPFCKYQSPLNALLANKYHLENLGIKGHFYYRTTFEDLPETVKNLRISIKESDIARCATHYMQLEHLHLHNVNVVLEELVETQNALKSLNVRCSLSTDEIYERIFAKNPELEDVTLEIAGTSLKHLPKSIKHLKLDKIPSEYHLDTLIDCLKTWQLESLDVGYSWDKIEKFPQKLIGASQTLQHLTIRSKGSKSLDSLKELKELKSLRLLNLEGNYSQAVRRITENCLNLEMLELSGFSFTGNQDLLASIAELPKLNKVILRGSLDKCSKDYSECMQNLSRSRSLTSARFISCNGLNNADAMILIRDCKNLMNLELSGHSLTANLVPQIKTELDSQENRTNMLNLKFTNVLFYPQDISQESSHPLLEVNIF